MFEDAVQALEEIDPENLQNVLRNLPDPISVEFARDFQASTAYRPLPAEIFERIVAKSLKVPPRLSRLLPVFFLSMRIPYDQKAHSAK